eukprot:Gb_26386 [translate_table: standard]
MALMEEKQRESDKAESFCMGPLPALISEAQACVLRPLEFFVAWQGVLTIAYSGFPPNLCKLKKRIHLELSGLMKENPGSMWPKTSLACLKDSKTLSMSQLVQLREICREESFSFTEEHAVVVDNLSVVLYENCCLEKTFMVTEVSLKHPVDSSEPSPDEKLYARSVLDEFADANLSSYYLQVSTEGNRTTHYRGSKVGSTIVHFLQKPSPLLARFKARVEAAMPGMYDWFLNDSLHITVRALF